MQRVTRRLNVISFDFFENFFTKCDKQRKFHEFQNNYYKCDKTLL